ncbi:HEC/Ndc80p family-domain-containing protein [Coniella lustricola]|uniref:Kinetochore protein NDC80 n=1 Tax=Coniella lustricola TaxID=2025994 RepID=A0A2T2ZTB9_9PEZI|nr:HEC/Ndc80p family-domain-containing protein [Coniella lustricola]
MKRSLSASLGPAAANHYSSSQHKRSVSGSRQSLAMSRPPQPLFTRSSSGAGANNNNNTNTNTNNNNHLLADSATAPLVSSIKRMSFQQPNSASTLKSYTPNGLKSQQQQQQQQQHVRASSDGERRSSVYRARTSTNAHMGSHQSFFQQAPQTAGVPRDPRPLKDRAYQARIGQELLDYLAAHNFELEMKHVLSQNVIKSPTQKDFNYMFQWLYHRIDPSYRFLKNIDQEVPPLLKQLRYPYEKGITKSQIAAVGGQNWSMFLGVLHWMMQLAQMLEAYSHNRYEDACAEAGVDVIGDHIIFDFLGNAYEDWLNMPEESSEDDAQQVLTPHVERMAQQFDKANEKYEREARMLEEEHKRLTKEIAELEKATPDPAVLDQHHQIMEEDRVKFEEYNTLAMQRSERYESRIQVLLEELDRTADELREAEEERRGLQKAVDDQGISMADIDRMTSERERLQKGIESAGQRLDEVKRKVADKEAEASRKLEDLERMVDRYNTLAYQIGLIPASAVNAKGVDFELRVTVNSGPNFGGGGGSGNNNSGGGGGDNDGLDNDRLLADVNAGYQPAHILNLDLRGQVRSALVSLRKEISERRSASMDAMMKDHELLDNIREAMEDKRNEVEALEHRVRGAEDEHEKTKEVTNAQRMASDAQIEKMEKELAKMRASLSETVQLMEQREMNVNIEYEQLTIRANALREELHTEITRMLNDTIKFKMHVQKSLEDYEGFVADELEKELNEDEDDDEQDPAEDHTEE